MKRIRFILSTLAASPGVLFVYSPLLVVLTLVGVAVPFATGQLIDGLISSIADAIIAEDRRHLRAASALRPSP